MSKPIHSLLVSVVAALFRVRRKDKNATGGWSAFSERTSCFDFFVILGLRDLISERQAKRLLECKRRLRACK
jgi:hypothetical protein